MSRELRGWGERGRGGAALLASPRVSFLLLLEGFFPRCQSGPIEKKRVGSWGGGDPRAAPLLWMLLRRERELFTERRNSNNDDFLRKGKGKGTGSGEERA